MNLALAGMLRGQLQVATRKFASPQQLSSKVLVCGCAVLNYASVLANSYLLSKNSKILSLQVSDHILADSGLQPWMSENPSLTGMQFYIPHKWDIPRSFSTTTHMVHSIRTGQNDHVFRQPWFLQFWVRRFSLSYLYIHELQSQCPGTSSLYARICYGTESYVAVALDLSFKAIVQ